MTELLSPKSLSDLAIAIDQQGKSPQFVTLRAATNSDFISFVLFKSRLYSNGYFGSYCWKTDLSLVKEQPWAEFGKDGELIAFHASGAHRIIARDLLGDEQSISFYRGTTGAGEDSIARMLDELSDWPGSQAKSQADWEKGILTLDGSRFITTAQQESIDSIRLQLKAQNFDVENLKRQIGGLLYVLAARGNGVPSISATPIFATAQGYVHGPDQFVTKTVFSRSEFLSLVDKDEIYVGFETTPEIAFISKAAQTEYTVRLSIVR